MAGFTTIRELGSWDFTDVATMRAIERGDIIGPHIIPSAHALSTTGGHCEVTGSHPVSPKVTTAVALQMVWMRW